MSTKSETNKTKSSVPSKTTRNYTIAKSDDGTVQITYTISLATIQKNQEIAASELGKDLEVPGFRKGKAPISKVIEHINHDQLIQSTLNQILPGLFGETIREEKLRPATYPKFELIAAPTDGDWQVRAITCELSEIDLGDYRNLIKSHDHAEIWTPDKGGAKDKKTELSREEKESEVIHILLDNIKVVIPAILIQEETDAKLSQLLSRLEKLSLNLDAYLKSVGKTPQNLREDYESQSANALALDLILNAIAEKEDVKVPESQIDEAIKQAQADPNTKSSFDTPEQRRLIESIIRRKMTLDKLVDLL